MLDFYLQHFNTVELNNTFYRLPAEKSVDQWRAAAPERFVYSAKGSRFITHMKKLKDPEPSLERYFSRVDRLGSRLGAIVWQLPPFWDLDLARLEHFLEALPVGRHAFEFRNPSWHCAPVYRLLERHAAAWCGFDLGGFRSPLEITADFAYVRLHGPGAPYQDSYSEAALDEWAGRVERWRGDLQAVYVYFDNDAAGHAARNALSLRARVGPRDM